MSDSYVDTQLSTLSPFGFLAIELEEEYQATLLPRIISLQIGCPPRITREKLQCAVF